MRILRCKSFRSVQALLLAALIRDLKLLFLLLLLSGTVSLKAADYTFTTSGDGINITTYTGAGGNVMIPDTIDGLPVRLIGANAFLNNASITAVSIPNSVATIGQSAFSSCMNLRTVTIPEGVRSISLFAFSRCLSLTNVTIPTSVTNIEVDVFARCEALAAINVSDGNPAYASLDGVLFNKAMTTLIQYPGGKGGNYSIPNTVTSLGTEAFGDSALTGVTIPLGITEIGPHMFSDCSSLTTATISASVTNLGAHAFSYCVSLKTLYFAGNAPSVGEDVFVGAGDFFGLILYYMAQTTGWTSTLAGWPTALWNPLQADFTYSKNNGQVTITGYQGSNRSVIVPDKIDGLPVTKIAADAFYTRNITSISLPDGVTSIGDAAFYQCYSLTNISIPYGVTTIGESTFLNCYALESLKIPSSVTSIGSGAFFNCYSLEAIYFAGDAPAIASGVFDFDPQAIVYYSPGTRGWNTTFGDRPTAVWNPLNIQFTSSAFEGQVTITGYYGRDTTVSVPATIDGLPVTVIGESAFARNQDIVSVTIPDGVITVEAGAFSSCGNLRELILPNTVRIIGASAFADSGLSSVTLPNQMTTIEDSTFSGCSSLTKITIPAGVTRIGSYAFFFSGLQAVSIPASVASIGSVAFNWCRALTNVFFSEGVTNIEEAAFADANLGSVTLPKSVSHIGDFAFADCDGLARVYCNGNAPDIGTNIFSSTPTIYFLPQTTGWKSDFAGCPTVLWNPQVPLNSPTFGFKDSKFGFTIVGTTNLVVIVEATPSLTSPIWIPVVTNILSNGSVFFSDPSWTSYSNRVYRFRSQ